MKANAHRLVFGELFTGGANAACQPPLKALEQSEAGVAPASWGLTPVFTPAGEKLAFDRDTTEAASLARIGEAW